MKRYSFKREKEQIDLKKLLQIREEKKKFQKKHKMKFLISEPKTNKELYEKLYRFDVSKELEEFMLPFEKPKKKKPQKFNLKRKLKPIKIEIEKENEEKKKKGGLSEIFKELFKEKNKFKLNKIQNAMYADRKVRKHIRKLKTGDDAIAFFAKYGNTTPIKFIHCVKNGISYNPYRLRIVHNTTKLAKAKEYYTVSPSGIV